MKVLFIGGTGVISSACAELCVARGIELTLLARGQSSRPAPAGAAVLRGDIRDAESARAVLGNREGVTAPIASATSLSQLESLVRATQFSLSAEQIALLDKASS